MPSFDEGKMRGFSWGTILSFEMSSTKTKKAPQDLEFVELRYVGKTQDMLLMGVSRWRGPPDHSCERFSLLADIYKVRVLIRIHGDESLYTRIQGCDLWVQ